MLLPKIDKFIYRKLKFVLNLFSFFTHFSVEFIYKYFTMIISEKYAEKNLKLCETKLNQRWRHASGSLVMSCINIFTNYFPELSLLIGSLENYSLCEGHYNQIIISFNVCKCPICKLVQLQVLLSTQIRTNEGEILIIHCFNHLLMMQKSKYLHQTNIIRENKRKIREFRKRSNWLY